MTTEDDTYYDDIGLGRCIIRKSASVTKVIAKELVLPIAIALCFVGIVATVAFVMINYFVPFANYLFALNPLVYVAALIVLPIPLYSTIWCIRHRKQMKEKKAFDSMPVCPIDEKKV